MPIGLDHPGALDPERAGAKAARLAAARRAGLSVLDGVVIEAAHSRPALAAAARVARERGPAAGQLAMMDAGLSPGLADAVRESLGAGRLVVRSSSPLEGGGEWSGAFASYVDVDPADLGTAILGCWASMLGRDALDRFERVGGDPAATGMAVLVQPAITASPGGVAETDDEGVHITVADDGELAGLLQGWARGRPAELPRSGAPSGPAVEAHGAALIERVGELALACRERLGDDHLEWAFAGGRCYLLQARRAQARRPARSHRPAAGLAGDEVIRIARAVARFGGASGDELVLPWCFAPGGASALSEAGTDQAASQQGAASLRSAARALTARAWRADEDRAMELARAAMARLRDPLDTGAVAELLALAPVDPAAGRRVVAAVERAAAVAVGAARLFDPADAWRLPPSRLDELLDGAFADAETLVPAAGAWEPFLREAVFANGQVRSGEPAADGAGAGRLARLEVPRRLAGVRERWILYVTNPLPAYAPLLWGAAGLISATGSPSAHLFDVARTLGVPAVAGVELAATHDNGVVVAVDGSAGDVVVL
jgi:phosphohistidine swiveling domain-containing protein